MIDKESKVVQVDYIRLFIERNLIALLILIGVSFPFLFIKSVIIGFFPNYVVYLIFSVVIVLLFIFRKRWSINILTIFIFLAYLTLGCAGLFLYGPSNPMIGFVVVAVLFVSVIWGIKIGLVLAGLFSLLILTNAILYNEEIIFPKTGLDQYQKSLFYWFLTGVSFLIQSFLLIISTFDFSKKLTGLSNKIKDQEINIEFLANHDYLTGLPSTELATVEFDTIIRLAKREKYKVAVLFIELEGITNINDEYGEEYRDFVIKRIAERLKRHIRESDTACRVGVDKFLVVLSLIHDLDKVKTFCERIIPTLSDELMIKDNLVSIGVNIGIALLPDDSSDSLELRKMAEKAVCDAKEDGKNNYIFFSDTDNG